MDNAKIIKIGDKEVGFKATAAIFYRYKEAFGIEYLEDLAKCKATNSGIFAMQVINRMIWVLAKTYDKSIPPCQEWLDSFSLEEYHYDEIWQELQPIIDVNYKVDRKNA